MLERLHDSLPILKCRSWSSRADFETAVERAFLDSGRLAPGLAPLLLSAAEALKIVPDKQLVLTGIRAFLEELQGYPLDSIEVDSIGTVFESIIPWVDRHQLGQFYTPPVIAEILVRWAVRRPTDRVLDPACGAGIILAKARAQLDRLSKDKSSQPLEVPHGEDNSHQVYGFDIDPAAVRLARASVALECSSQSSEVATCLAADFFNILPSGTTDARTAGQGVSIAHVDAVVTNPPYTRWSELSRSLRSRIQGQLAETLRAYHLSPKRGWGGEAGLHVYFVLWAHRFLRPGGRLAMIVSNSWLQTDFGTAFGRFLLDHFRVRAVVDLGAHVFPAPTVGACLLLLEREDDPLARDANATRLIYLNGADGGQPFDVEGILRAIDSGQLDSLSLNVREVVQRTIPRDSKWVQSFFDVGAYLGRLERSSLMIRLEHLCDIVYGNTAYLVLTSKGAIHGVPNIGGERFFYLSDHEARTSRLSLPWVHPLLPSARCAQFFRFTKKDWKAMQRQGARCWLFTAHSSRRLPRSVLNYIRRGEHEVTLRRMKRSSEKTKTVSESFASSVRRMHPEYFRGWFDLGAPQPVPIFAGRGAQHRPRFVLTDFPIALDDRLIALIPKSHFERKQQKALVAALNSTFTQLQIEATCRSTGGGMVELDLRNTARLLVPNVSELSSQTVAALAASFEELEKRARQLGGACSRAQLDALTPLFDEIDAGVAKAIGLPKDSLRQLKDLSGTLVRRRLSRLVRPQVT